MQACVIEVESQLHELVNPKIVRATGDDRDLEGCLSIPGYVAYVTRRERVWVVAQNRNGQKIKVAGSGLLGRALQHELDHLEGKLYIDYLDSMDELLPVGAGKRGRRRGPRGDERPGVTPRTDGLRRAASVLGASDATRVRTVFLGSGAFGRESLRRLAAHPEVDLVGVVTAPARPAGRSGRPSPTVIAGVAADLRLPVLTPERLRAPEAVDEVIDPPPAAPGPRRLRADRARVAAGRAARGAEPASVAAPATSRRQSRSRRRSLPATARRA